MTRCSNCGTEVAPDEPGDERRPCPNCGSPARTHEASASASVSVSASAQATVERGLNDIRLAVLGILVGIALAVGFGVPGSWTVQFVAGLGSFVLSCLLIRWSWSQSRLMTFMHWLTGA